MSEDEKQPEQETADGPELPSPGQWVEVVDGPGAGLYGVYLYDVEHEPDASKSIVVRNRDHGNQHSELAVVEHKHTRPSARTGGR